jgi:hypothetical protein
MLVNMPVNHTWDPGRKLTEEERRELEPLYSPLRPVKKLCRVQCTNDGYRVGHY